MFSYGVTDDPAQEGGTGNVRVFSPRHREGVLVKAESLTKNVPKPFSRELTGGGAHKIHHKFVIVDFNDSDPVLFTGSSNLSEGGEEANGDNLIAVYDREVATAFAIEAIRLVDHYVFRSAMQTATAASPLRLKPDADRWWKRYYQDGSMKKTERLLFSR